MKERILSIIKKKCMAEDGDTILLGVSGGIDSLCLLDIFHESGCQLVVGHLDHGLRAESGDEAAEVERVVSSKQIEFLSEKVDVLAFAESRKLSIEEAARILRYRFLFRSAEDIQANAVAVGHNADDQVETILMHLLRGSGIAGLRGMNFHSLPNEWSRSIPLIRPLLSTWREEIEAFMVERSYVPIMDASNQDHSFYRNRLRHDLIPYLEDYNPRIRKLLWQTGITLQGDYEILVEQIETAWDSCLVEQGQDYIAFSLEKMRRLTDGLIRHLVRKAFFMLRPNFRDITFESLDLAPDFIRNPPATGQSDVIGNLRFQMEGDLLWFADWDASLPVTGAPQYGVDSTASLDVPGRITLHGGWTLTAEIISNRTEVLSSITANEDMYQAWIDLDSLTLPLTLRTRCKGDRIKPHGMAGRSMKLADLMVNKKIPRRLRSGWPIIVSENEVVWVPGHTLAEPYLVKSNTEKILHLSVILGE